MCAPPRRNMAMEQSYSPPQEKMMKMKMKSKKAAAPLSSLSSSFSAMFSRKAAAPEVEKCSMMKPKKAMMMDMFAEAS